MKDEDNFGAIFASFIIIMALVFIGVFVFLIIKANEAVDIQAANINRQWQIDKKNCESKGGIAIQSAWSGQITDCKKV